MGWVAPVARIAATSVACPTAVKVVVPIGLWSLATGTWHPPFSQHDQLTVSVPREYGSLKVSNMTDLASLNVVATDVQNVVDWASGIARCPSATDPAGAVQCRSRM